MSTAGKVLVVLVTLTTLVWMILASGVSQLNHNGNNLLHELNVQLEKAQVDLKQTRADIQSFRDETSNIQSTVDRDITMLNARLADVQNVRSQIVDGLERLKYQLGTVDEAIKGAETALQHRKAERQAEEKALADAKAEVQSLMAESSQLTSRLNNLRQTFQTTYKANVEMLGKTH
jgi:chromosome segregation ATPase